MIIAIVALIYFLFRTINKVRIILIFKNALKQCDKKNDDTFLVNIE